MSISVRTDFPSGNASLVEVREEAGQTQVRFTSDPCGGPEALWFYLRLEADAEDDPAEGPIDLVLTCVENLLCGAPAEQIRPVVRLDDGPWGRLGPGRVEAIPGGRAVYHWQIDRPTSFAEVALCYPYHTQQLNALIQDLQPGWHADPLGVSQEGRPITRVGNDHGQPQSDRPGIYLVARQHSGETPGSWVLDGLLRRLHELGDQAPLVWAIPLSNIDGVEAGAYGKDNFPYDLNRAWGRPAMRHEVLVIQRDMQRWAQRCRPMCALDLHSPGGAEKAGVYAFQPKDTAAPVTQAIEQLAQRIEQHLGTTYVPEQFARFANYPSRWNTPNHNMGTYCAQLMELPALTVEITYALSVELVMTVDHYRTVGQRIADALCEHCAAQS